MPFCGRIDEVMVCQCVPVCACIMELQGLYMNQHLFHACIDETQEFIRCHSILALARHGVFNAKWCYSMVALARHRGLLLFHACIGKMWEFECQIVLFHDRISEIQGFKYYSTPASARRGNLDARWCLSMLASARHGGLNAIPFSHQQDVGIWIPSGAFQCLHQ